MTLKPFQAPLAAIMVTMAAVLAVPTARAETPLDQTRIDSATPSLVVHLNANGSVVISQRDEPGGRGITLPSIQALSAEIDALVPRSQERAKLGVAVDPTVLWLSFVVVMDAAKNAGFAKIGVLGLEKDSRDGRTELTIALPRDNPTPDINKALFVSLGSDGAVVVSSGIGQDAKGSSVDVAGAPDVAAGLVPNGRPEKQVYFRADLDAHVGNALELLHRLDAIGFKKVNIAVQALEKDD